MGFYIRDNCYSLDGEDLFLMGCEPPLNVINFGLFDIQHLFICCCKYGYLRLVKYIYKNYEIDIHAKMNKAFYYSCENGHLNVIKWLVRKDRSIIKCGDINDALCISCCNGYLKVAKFLYKIVGDISILEVIKSLKTNYFRCSVNILKWLYRVFNMDVYKELKSFFTYSCVHGKIDIMNCFFKSVGKDILYVFDDYKLLDIFSEGSHEVVEWLMYKRKINIYHLEDYMIKRINEYLRILEIYKDRTKKINKILMMIDMFMIYMIYYLNELNIMMCVFFHDDLSFGFLSNVYKFLVIY